MAGAERRNSIAELEPVVGIEPTTYGLRIQTERGRPCSNMRFCWGFSSIRSQRPASSPRQSVPNCPKNFPPNAPSRRAVGGSSHRTRSRVPTGLPTHAYRSVPGWALPRNTVCFIPAWRLAKSRVCALWVSTSFMGPTNPGPVPNGAIRALLRPPNRDAQGRTVELGSFQKRRQEAYTSPGRFHWPTQVRMEAVPSGSAAVLPRGFGLSDLPSLDGLVPSAHRRLGPSFARRSSPISERSIPRRILLRSSIGTGFVCRRSQLDFPKSQMLKVLGCLGGTLVASRQGESVTKAWWISGKN